MSLVRVPRHSLPSDGHRLGCAVTGDDEDEPCVVCVLEKEEDTTCNHFTSSSDLKWYNTPLGYGICCGLLESLRMAEVNNGLIVTACHDDE